MPVFFWDIPAPVSNPNRTHWIPKLDFGVIRALTCHCFPIWEIFSSPQEYCIQQGSEITFQSYIHVHKCVHRKWFKGALCCASLLSTSSRWLLSSPFQANVASSFRNRTVGTAAMRVTSQSPSWGVTELSVRELSLPGLILSDGDISHMRNKRRDWSVAIMCPEPGLP